MRDTASPLSRVAQGMPVSGEPVAVPDAARRGSEATDEEREEAEGRLLWVTGFPLSEAGERRRAAGSRWWCSCSSRARGRSATSRWCATAPWSPPRCRSRSPTPSREQNPLVWVNPAFTRLTGLRARRGPRAQLPLPAGPEHRPGLDLADPHRAGRGAPDHRGAAQLPPRRHRVLEPGLDHAGARRQRARGQLRRRPDRRHRARDGRARAPRRARRRGGGPRAAAAAHRVDRRR